MNKINLSPTTNLLPVIIISGPTATGKSALAPKLASHLKEKSGTSFAIVNFDSLLFYKELNIGTAKPSKSELEQNPHHLIDITSINTPINAAGYIQRALPLISQLHAEGQGIILVGGSGFYLRALIKGMFDSKTDTKIRNELQRLYKSAGINFFLDYLKIHDPDSLDQLHQNDHYRLMRAVEHHQTTQTKFSLEKKRYQNFLPYDFSINQHPQWKILHHYLDIPKVEHWDCILKRTETMLSDGLIAETQKLLNNGFNGSEKPLQSIGYKQVLQYLKKEIPGEKDLTESISIATRQLAKAQRTFFKKITPKFEYHPVKDENKILQSSMVFLDSCRP